MRILRVVSSYYPALKYGGTISSEYYLDSELSKTIDIDVCTTNAGQNKVKIGQWTKINKINVVYFSYIGYEHFNFSVPLLFFLIKNVHKYDLVQISGVWNFPVLLAPLISRIKKIPYVMTLHGTIFEHALQSKRKAIKKILFHLLVKRNILKADKIHFTSKREVQELNKMMHIPDDRIFISPFGLPHGFFATDIEKNNQISKYKLEGYSKIILFVGRVHPIKGVGLLIESFSKIKDNSDICLVVLGPYDPVYKESIINNFDKNIIESVVFTGEVYGKEKEVFYQIADLFILPSYSENLGMVVIEAMQNKLPIIITTNVGIASLVGEMNGVDVLEYDSDAIMEAIVHKLKNESDDVSLRNEIYSDFCKLFLIEIVSNDFKIMYRGLIDGQL
jgi:glycosyltransferase involved in cell wall biosynthesis